MASNNEGSVEMVLDIRDGMVVQEFQRPMKRVIYEPRNIIAVATKMTDLAFEADTKLKPVGDSLKAELVERHRVTLINRLALVLKDKRMTKMNDRALSRMLVEIMLREVF